MTKAKPQKKKRNPADVPQYGLRKIRRLLKEHGEQLAALDADNILLNEGLADLNHCMALNVESLNTRLTKLEAKRGRR
jgi:hypothetical protein